MASVTPYTETQIGEALTCFALANGSMKRCQELLEARDLGMAYGTVRCWAYERKQELYVKIRATIEEYSWAHLADVQLELVHANADIEREILAQIQEKLGSKELDGKELANLHRSVAISGGVKTDKSMALSGKPSQIVQHDFADITRILEQQHGIRIAAGTQPSVSVVDTKELEPA